MTRINLVPPAELADQHLFAEFRELKMVPKSLERSLNAKGVIAVTFSIPPKYVLGRGHVSFFYDKGAYLTNRYVDIQQELQRRKINYNKEAMFDPDFVYLRYPCFGRDYNPTEEALQLIRARLAEKIAMKPNWYRWTPTNILNLSTLVAL